MSPEALRRRLDINAHVNDNTGEAANCCLSPDGNRLFDLGRIRKDFLAKGRLSDSSGAEVAYESQLMDREKYIRLTYEMGYRIKVGANRQTKRHSAITERRPVRFAC